MTFDLQDSPHEATDHLMAEAGEGEQPSGFRLDLMIEDPESIAAIVAYPGDRERAQGDSTKKSPATRWS